MACPDCGCEIIITIAKNANFRGDYPHYIEYICPACGTIYIPPEEN